MTAYLDTQRHRGEHTGGVSDPRLIRKVDALHPDPLREDEIASVEEVIRAFAKSPDDESVLRAMILPETYQGKYVLELPEEAQ